MKVHCQIPLFSAGVIALFLASLPCYGACEDTEGDRLTWARERMFPAATRGQTQAVYDWLVNSTRSCNQSGDLWYYRSLAARKLGLASDAQYAAGKATDNESKEQAAHFDPYANDKIRRVSSPDHIREKYALLVGIHKFKVDDANLRYSAADALALKKTLVEHANFKEANVHTLVDDQATLDAIRSELSQLHGLAQPDDLVLIYFSSHGAPRHLDPTGISYIKTYEFDGSDASTQFKTGLKMVELAEFGRYLNASNYVLLLDTCYSGDTKYDANTKPHSASGGLDPLQSLQGSANRVVISASADNETSSEDDSSRHGLFTRYLLDALGNSATANLTSMFDSVQKHVVADSAQRHVPQHPVMLAYGEGAKIALGAAPVVAAARPRSNDTAAQ